ESVRQFGWALGEDGLRHILSVRSSGGRRGIGNITVRYVAKVVLIEIARFRGFTLNELPTPQHNLLQRIVIPTYQIFHCVTERTHGAGVGGRVLHDPRID